MSIFMDMVFYNISTYKLQLFYIFWKETRFHFEMFNTFKQWLQKM
jgi:hypothetical protein